MISKPTLKFLILKFITDAEILLANKRYTTAIYLSGYALELMLKYRICKIMIFNQGFPESKPEFNAYFANASEPLLRSTIRALRDIKHHKLEILLRFSGEQYNIETNFSLEWSQVKDWDPEMRYKKITLRKQEAEKFSNSAKRIIDNLI